MTPDEIKRFFEDGDKPTGAHFAALVDLAAGNGGNVPLASVIGLVATITELQAAITQAATPVISFPSTPTTSIPPIGSTFHSIDDFIAAFYIPIVPPDPPVYSTIYHGFGTIPTTLSEILAGTAQQIISTADIVIDFRAIGYPAKVWMAQLLTQPPKTYVYMAAGNEFPIGSAGAISGVVNIETYGLYAWDFETEFVNLTQYKKQQ